MMAGRNVSGDFIAHSSYRVTGNADIYTMPEYRVYPVRDRASREFRKAWTAPRQFTSRDDMEANCRRFDNRPRPLVIGTGSTFGTIRSLMGVEAASLAPYDDPELIHDMIDTWREHNRKYLFPLIERRRPAAPRWSTSPR